MKFEVRKEEYKECHKCGDVIKKHIVEDGARYHVVSWVGEERRCSEKDCEINHKCREKG